MKKFEVKGVPFQIVGTKFEIIDGVKVWFHSVKNLTKGTYKEIEDEKLKKYLK